VQISEFQNPIPQKKKKEKEKQDQTVCCLQETHLTGKDAHRLTMKG
jgi:hypothetical protein